jgi:hypothetical protein
MAKEKEAKVNESAVVAKLNEEMLDYEVERKGLPPSAKGKVRAGRSQHSTNLVQGDPACMCTPI